ncbi:MAG TPA: (Fe-S)-binding protein, partial [Polyangia bacterium]
ELVRHEAVLARAEALAPRVATLREGEGAAFAQLVVGEALPRTDCGQCGHATCSGYAVAIASGRERALGKCGPGGAKATRDVHLLMQLRAGAPPADAAAHAIAATLRRHQ